MNKLLPIIIFSVLFTIGCENFFGIDNDSGNPYANDMLLYDLEQELALSEKQISDSRNFLRNGRDYFPDNTSLWKLALYLQQNLTEEQKQSLLTPPDHLIAEEASEENDYHHKRLRHHERMDEFIRSILNENQLSDYDEITSYKKTALEEIFISLKDGTHTKQEIHSQMMGVMEWFRASMDKLLTDEQKSILEQMRKQKDDHWRKNRGGYGKHSKDPNKMRQEMYDVLSLTTEQISTLETLEESFKSSLESLYNDFVDGIVNYTPEQYIQNVIGITDSFHEVKVSIFDTVQLEIIEIHRALARRFMKHSRWGHKG
ncbi:MAG: hypothetical protein P8L91_00315 [Candidatus Marinimicrobia bacterium]|nr:hypothetical protein [Candidatus Neomarinimicrobiota bacterium]